MMSGLLLWLWMLWGIGWTNDQTRKKTPERCASPGLSDLLPVSVGVVADRVACSLDYCDHQLSLQGLVYPGWFLAHLPDG
jgi:hypothetical protein